jgi:hypothetical protein
MDERPHREGRVTILLLPDDTQVGAGHYRYVHNAFTGREDLVVWVSEWSGAASPPRGARPRYFKLRLKGQGLTIPRGFFVPPVGPRSLGSALQFRRLPPLGLRRE